MKSKFTIALVAVSLFVLAITSTGCKKEKVKGCKTSYATNFNSSAEEDNGSCTYEAKVIFWQTLTNAAGWSALGVTALSFYVDGQFIGSCAATEYNGSVPTCGGSGQASVTKNLGTSSSKSYSWSIKDEDGYEWYSGSITLDASSSCTTQKFD